jgi:hypothetical protein
MYATWNRDLRVDLERLRGIPHRHPRDPAGTVRDGCAASNLGRAATRAGLRWISFPIADMSVPTDIEATITLVRALLGSSPRLGPWSSTAWVDSGARDHRPAVWRQAASRRAIAIVGAPAGRGASASGGVRAPLRQLVSPAGSPPSLHQGRAMGERTRGRQGRARRPLFTFRLLQRFPPAAPSRTRPHRAPPGSRPHGLSHDRPRRAHGSTRATLQESQAGSPFEPGGARAVSVRPAGPAVEAGRVRCVTARGRRGRRDPRGGRWSAPVVRLYDC